MHAMGVLSLQRASMTAKPRGCVDGEATVDKHLKRLAQAAEVEFEDLRAQYREVRPLAEILFAGTAGISELEGWRQAIDKKSKRCEVKALRTVLCLHAVYHGFSTSCVERGFKKQDILQVNKCRAGQSEDLEHDELTLSSTGGYEDAELLSLARSMYWLMAKVLQIAGRSDLIHWQSEGGRSDPIPPDPIGSDPDRSDPTRSNPNVDGADPIRSIGNPIESDPIGAVAWSILFVNFCHCRASTCHCGACPAKAPS